MSPRACAVLRLMTSSNFVDCSTGKSAGLAPFRILSTYVAHAARGPAGSPHRLMRPPASTSARSLCMVGRWLVAASLGGQSAVLTEHGVPQDKERTRVRTGQGREGTVKRVGTARLHEVQLDAQRLGRHVRPSGTVQGVDGIGGIPEDGHTGDGGEHVLEELQLFPESSGCRTDCPVMLPPGRARLATRPLPTGSSTPTITMGIVVVASLAASAAGVAYSADVPWRRTNSAARAGNRSYCPAAPRYSMTRFWPST